MDAGEAAFLAELADGHGAGHLDVEMPPAIPDDGFQFEQFGEFAVGRAVQLKIALEIYLDRSEVHTGRTPP